MLVSQHMHKYIMGFHAHLCACHAVSCEFSSCHNNVNPQDCCSRAARVTRTRTPDRHVGDATRPRNLQSAWRERAVWILGLAYQQCLQRDHTKRERASGRCVGQVPAATTCKLCCSRANRRRCVVKEVVSGTRVSTQGYSWAWVVHARRE